MYRSTTLTLLLMLGTGPGGAAPSPLTGNVIFIHPDGTGLNHWIAARMYWNGPDGVLAWDQLPELAVYRGHMSDRLTGTSNGGATTHAFGWKVQGSDSYGRDGDRPIRSLSGYPGSILREAAQGGHPVGAVNDGDAAEPGTGAFLAEVSSRREADEIARQILEGRPGFQDPDPAVVLGGGERFFLPVGTPPCGGEVRPDCAVHLDPVSGAGPARDDGRNLIVEALEDEWRVVRTRGELETLQAELLADPAYAPKVLGLFAADDIFNDAPEETLLERDLVDPARSADEAAGRLIIWGTLHGRPGFDPPSASEMTEVALLILERRSRTAGKPFLLITEVESTDNLANVNNAIGSLRALARADAVIETAQRFLDRSPATLILTAADSDGGGLQVLSPPPLQGTRVGAARGNPAGPPASATPYPLDGIEGRGTAPFISAPDAAGQRFPFAVAWTGTADVAGGIVARAAGLNAHLLRRRYALGFDNTDVYRMMYLTLFGRDLPQAVGGTPPGRHVGNH